jgi:hypothetical protein
MILDHVSVSSPTYEYDSNDVELTFARTVHNNIDTRDFQPQTLTPIQWLIIAWLRTPSRGWHQWMSSMNDCR